MNNKKYLFVCGTPRSGTTAIQQLLSADERLIIGPERYGGYLGSDNFDKSLFTYDRFVDFLTDPRDHSRKNPFYDTISRERFDSSSFVGDKIPLLYLHFNKIQRNFPGAKYIVILRNILDIANSYQNRLNNPKDIDWEHSYIDAVSHWNSLIDFTKAHLSNPQIHFVLYEDLYSSFSSFSDIYQFLELQENVGVQQSYQNCIQVTSRNDSRRINSLDEQAKLYILRNSNLIDYQTLINSPYFLKSASGNRNKNALPPSLSLEDIESAFRIFLGRNPTSSDEASILADMDSSSIVRHFLASREFLGSRFRLQLILQLAAKILAEKNLGEPPI